MSTKSGEFQNQNGKPYENDDLWDRFLKARSKIHFHTEMSLEKGKTRDILKRVDTLAKKGAKNPSRKDFGYKPGKFTSSRVVGGAATPYPAAGQTVVARITSKRLYGEKEEIPLYRLTFDLYNEVSDTYTQKHSVYQEQGELILKRNNCYRLTMNDDVKLPRILVAEPIPYLMAN